MRKYVEHIWVIEAKSKDDPNDRWEPLAGYLFDYPNGEREYVKCVFYSREEAREAVKRFTDNRRILSIIYRATKYIPAL